jgi:hypothetical protein
MKTIMVILIGFLAMVAGPVLAEAVEVIVPVEPAGFLDKLNSFLDAFPVWLAALTTVVTAATAITIITPTKSDDKVIAAILKVLNLLSGNIGNNKNKDE